MTREGTRQAFAQALQEARKAENAAEMAAARKLFWQAHQLARNDTIPHVISHFALLRFALRTRQFSEAWSQLWLTIGALLLTWLRPRMPDTRQPSGRH